MQLTEELQHLRRELEDLKLKETNLEIRTDIRLDAIEQRIEALFAAVNQLAEEQAQPLAPKVAEPSAMPGPNEPQAEPVADLSSESQTQRQDAWQRKADIKPIEHTKPARAEMAATPVAAKAQTASESSAAKPFASKYSASRPTDSKSSAAQRALPQTQEGREQQTPNWGRKFDQAVAAFFAAMLSPLLGLFAQAKDFYQHYQAKGQGPVFMMTLAGIIAMTLGFGYLLQYSMNHWLSDTGKALTGFVCANGILALGAFIRKRQRAMADFGSGLVGLGLIINYLCAYFVGPYFELVPDGVSYLLLLLITVVGYSLALKLEARVISIVALLGGSLAPLMLLSGSQAPLMYLPFLLLIGGCSLLLSHKIRWPVLLETTAILHIACIESLSFFVELPLQGQGIMGVLALISLHGLFYGYGLGSLWLFGREGLSHRLLALPAALLAFLVYSLSQFSPHAGELLLANAAVLIGLSLWLKQDKQLQTLLWLATGACLGFAALSLLSGELLGLVLLLEALLLMWLGCREQQASLRIEAITLLALGLVINLLALGDMINEAPALLSLPLLAWGLSTLTLFGFNQLLGKQPELSRWEQQLLQLGRELANVLLVSLALVSAWLISESYFLVIIPGLSLTLLLLARRQQLRVSEALAWALLLPLAAQVIFAAVDVHSLSFRAQPLYAQIARVELFLCLLLTWYAYRRFHPKGELRRLAWYTRLACLVLLPLLWLPKVALRFEDWLAPALWLSCFVSLVLARKFRQPILKREADVLLVLAIAQTAFACLAGQWPGLIALLLGSIYSGLLLWRYPSLPRLWQGPCRLGWQLSPFYGALLLAVVSHSLEVLFSHTLALSSVVLSGYFFILLSRKPLKALRPGYPFAFASFFIALLLPWLSWLDSLQSLQLDALTRPSEPWLMALAQACNLALLALFIRKRPLAMRRYRQQLPTNMVFIAWHALLLLAYLPLAYQMPTGFDATLSTVLMVSHGCWLMFLSLRPGCQIMLKLAAGLFAISCLKVLLLDMAAADLLQKIIVFMLIGALLLGVAYFYQKSRARLLSQ